MRFRYFKNLFENVDKPKRNSEQGLLKSCFTAEKRETQTYIELMKVTRVTSWLCTQSFQWSILGALHFNKSKQI